MCILYLLILQIIYLLFEINLQQCSDQLDCLTKNVIVTDLAEAPISMMTSSSLLLTVVFSVLEAMATVEKLRLITTLSMVIPPARLLLLLLWLQTTSPMPLRPGTWPASQLWWRTESLCLPLSK